MPNFKDSKIYAVKCLKDSNLIYIGSTTQKLNCRLKSHKYHCKNEKFKNMLLYKVINERFDGNWDNWEISLIEEYPCNNRTELLRKEGEYIKSIATLNSLIAGRTSKEYYDDEDNKKRHQETEKKYREQNKELIKEKQKTYYELNREKIQQKYNETKNILNEKRKVYRQSNKEKIKEQKKLEYQKNKQNYLDRAKQYMEAKKIAEFLKVFE